MIRTYIIGTDVLHGGTDENKLNLTSFAFSKMKNNKILFGLLDEYIL